MPSWAPTDLSRHDRSGFDLAFCVSKGVPRRSLLVALVVGSILNLINQYEGLFGMAPINWYKIALTYSVPYLVATYGAVSVYLEGRAIST
ncbi:MAG: nitrate/nitrite transporter NrtS [Actinobacteria bacterium]|nr:nitrate/nitrite transporter NrtS [Actinomycetota bacterium]